MLEIMVQHHCTPTEKYTVQRAHTVMQEHRACLREQCRRKQAAWDVLVAAKHIVPDTGRLR